MTGCQHEPALTILAGRELVTSVICPCALCGELVEFFIHEDDTGRRHLSLVPAPKGTP